MHAVLGWLRRTPFALAMMAATVAVHLVAVGVFGRLPRHLAAEFGFQAADLLGGRWWNAFTTLFLSTSTASMVLGLAVLCLVLGLAEFTVGTLRAAGLFLATQLSAVVLYSVLLGVGGAAGIDFPAGMEQATLLGPFAASAGALLVASPAISVLWRRRVRVLVLATALMLSVYVGHAQHTFILLAAVAGLLLGMALVKPVGHGMVGRSTSREVRTNLAMVVAVFAVGPLAATLAHVPEGPLAVLRLWITNQDTDLPPVPSHCTADQVADVCDRVVHNVGFMQTGSHLLALVPMVLLLVCAEGLRRGNRLALWAAVYLHLVIAVVSAFYFQVFAGVGLALRRGHRRLSIDESVWELLPVVLVPALIALALVVFRRHFRVDPDPALRRRSLVYLPVILLVFVALYTAAWLAEGNLEDNPLGLVALIAGIPRIVLPYPFPFSYSASVYPHGVFSELLFSFGGPALWLVSALGILAVFLSRHLGASGTDRNRAQALVAQGGDSLSWMTLWQNNRYWFSAVAPVGVAYQVHNGVAVTVGGPIGSQALAAEAVDGFLDYCAEESLTPCFYSVNSLPAELLESRGFKGVEVAAETLLDIRTMEFKGKDWQNVRTALNKADKLGVSCVWSRYGELTTSQRTQLNEISEDWVSGQALPELGFTLGGVEELKDPQVQLCLAVDADGKVHAATSWLPVHDGGEVVSWTLDFMRRNSGAFNGVMEYLVAQAVRHFAPTVEYISLSGSPLAGSAELEGTLGRILALLARTLEPVYGFASLANFKQRFKPRHRPLFLMYQDPLSLPAIGRAVGEAYMPNMSVRSLARVLRKP
ncbi:lysylphosphatidylglycerol synthetase-like protein (DUF2156 family) [Arthrobacter stackebrandtii]|uniref:Lysylphosphatidylglycerol synthetase-like protein (DUF2156 family) n=1 Tax=Arthrobacter stackebrandtii TaxID=272161 RepID=A0ABS4YZK6_9MICC|nr:DUF2156 domain-containing protein [Arthrobacter stackebrandtii]MBP2413900.1 lysylphosphatidylglycerol synthetase-like protein (DUF2156 family) [Arthrobacter stackebrandtii]PYH00468.1 hypothetical protein CVV67_10230 [Arthrobacter stackebrandtii]